MSQEQDNPDIEEAKTTLRSPTVYGGGAVLVHGKTLQLLLLDHDRLSWIVKHVKLIAELEWLDFNCPQCGTQNYIDDSGNKNDKICKCWSCGKYFTWDNDVGIYLTEPNDNAAKGINFRQYFHFLFSTREAALFSKGGE